MKPSDKDRNDVPFGGALGNELRKMWDAIRANQVVSSKDMRVSRTTKGTIVEAVGAASSTTIKNTTIAASGGLHVLDIPFYENEQAGYIDANGWVTSAWIHCSGSAHVLLAPLTTEAIFEARTLWGIGATSRSYTYPDGHRRKQGSAYGPPNTHSNQWASLSIPTEIARSTSGKWESPMGLTAGSGYNHQKTILAHELVVPLPATIYRDMHTNTYISLPQIEYIQAHPPRQWMPIA